MLPSVQITKQDFQTGVVKPLPTGNLAIISPSQQGTDNQPSTFTRPVDASTTFGIGPLAELASYDMGEAELPSLLIKPTTATAASYSSIVPTIAGTCVVTSGGTSPLDWYTPVVNVVTGGTVGTSGITYKAAADGLNFATTTALGTANSITIPNTGISFALAAGTLVSGDSWTCTTTPASMTNTDLSTSLEALRVTRLPWDTLLVDMSASANTVSLLDTWLAGQEASGVFKLAVVNTRFKEQPTETEASYAAALATQFANASSIRVMVCADGGDLVSPLTGLTQSRPTSLFVATRAMSIPDISVDPARVSDGPLAGVSIDDGNGNPAFHDEDLYPGLDALRLTTLRSFANEQGVYVTNANLISPNGSDYVYFQQARVMNAACTIAFAELTTQLSQGIRQDPKTGYILEKDAARIEALVNEAISAQLSDQATAIKFTLSRTDNISSNAGATVTGTVSVDGLRYIKTFRVNAQFASNLGS